MRYKIINRSLLALCVFCVGLSAIFLVFPDIFKFRLEILGLENFESSADVAMWLITVLFGLLSLGFRKPVLKHEVYCRDQYFVDRTEEREVLFAFLETENTDDSSLFFVKSGMCRGKTVLLQRFADDVNSIGKKNELQKKHLKAKNYSAYYIGIHQSCEDILQEISQQLCGNKTLNTYEKATDFLKKASYRKKALLIIDNINRMQSHIATELAHGLLYKNLNLKIILAITEEMSTIKPHTLTPPLFGEMHINELARVFKKDLPVQAGHEIVRISHGIPSYVRMIFQTNVLAQPVTLSNIEDIQKIIEGQLSRISGQNFIAFYLACLNLCHDGAVAKTDLLALSKASESQLEEIFDAALAREEMIETKSYILMDRLVAQCCLKTIHCDKYFIDIYNYYRIKDSDSDIALVAQLLLSDPSLATPTEEILKEKYEKRKFLLFARLGNLEQNGRLWALQTDYNLNNTFRYYYLSSLLQLGEYSQAISALERYERSSIPLPSLRECYNPSGFEMQFLIIDMHHLSNQFTLALGEIEAVLSNPLSIRLEHQHRLLYLKAHCLKHLGRQLQEADYILEKLEVKKLSPSFRIKVLYSRMAIHLFWGDKEFDYKTIIQHLESLSKAGTPEWIHTIRHLAHYVWIQTSHAGDALKSINEGLETLEITRWRIIYDFYFEKAEWMRIQNTEEQAPIHNVSAILNFYEKAIEFAENNYDINLACCARLGKILAIYPERGHDNSWCKKQWEIADSEYRKMDEAGLDINKAYAAYTKALLSKDEPSPEFICYCRESRFYDLVQHIEKGKVLKITVM